MGLEKTGHCVRSKKAAFPGGLTRTKTEASGRQGSESADRIPLISFISRFIFTFIVDAVIGESPMFFA